MFHAISAVLVMYVFWLLLSGHFTAFLLAAGAGSAIAVVLFSRRMGDLGIARRGDYYYTVYRLHWDRFRP